MQGFDEFAKRLVELRKGNPAFAALPVRRAVRPGRRHRGDRVHGRHELEVVLAEPYPQILYWFAMPFTAPVPWEAVAYYDGKEGRATFAEHPVGTGPFRLARYEKQNRIVLERNATGTACGTRMARARRGLPDDGEPEDIAGGASIPRTPAAAAVPRPHRGSPRAREHPALQQVPAGLLRRGGIIQESFDAVHPAGRLSPEMEARGMRLDKEVEPGVYYLGFNMDDPVVGTPAGERGASCARR